MNIVNIKLVWEAVHAALGFVGGFIGWFLDGYDGFLIALIAFVAVDYLTGVVRAVVEKSLSSKIGAAGIAKKLLIFLIVGAAHLIDAYLIQSGAALRTAVIFFYISNEGLSLLENTVAVGLPVPEKLRDVLAQLHNKGGY
jgi:toxin secretion/phage lysis holin